MRLYNCFMQSRICSIKRLIAIYCRRQNVEGILLNEAVRYLHACIMHVQGEQLTNSSLRKRFGLKESSSGSVSRLIKEAVEKGILKPLDPSTAPRYMKYIPIWA